MIWREDGSINFRCTVDGLDEIVWWILSMGPHCLGKRPAELASRVRDLADRLHALYVNPEGEGSSQRTRGKSRKPRTEHRP